MNIKLLCFTKDNEVIGFCSDSDLVTVLKSILIQHTFSMFEEFESIQEIIDYFQDECNINVTRLSLDIEEEN